ncbi:fibroblast growth factor-binding protein 1-like [Polymixia lowei]
MLLLRTLAPWFLLACLAQQLSVSAGAREKARKGSAEARGAERSARDRKASAPGGKFSTGDSNMRCTWVAKEDGDAVRLRVACQNPEARVTGGVTDLTCEYAAKPASCPGYVSKPGSFWKQVSRAMKKLRGKVCRALEPVKAGMCKRAPRDAHFTLDVRTAVVSAQQPRESVESSRKPRPGTGTTTTTAATTTVQTPAGPVNGSACTERVDQRKLGEEYCSSSWASLCTFFFSMVQSGDC